MKRIPATTENIKGWDDIPLVKLGKILERMIWFDGSYNFSYYNKTHYKEYKNIPNETQIRMHYREHDIVINCNWEIRKAPYYSNRVYSDRFAIGIERPYHPDFRIRKIFVESQIIYRHTKFYSIAIDKIEDAIYDAQEVIDKKIAEEEAEKKREIELKVIRDKLCKNLEVTIDEHYGSSYASYAYREDSEYHLNFESIDSIGKFFTIEEIGGEYTETEIKKFIEIIGGSPRAVTERLIGSKQ